jgi:hypothetical protein
MSNYSYYPLIMADDVATPSNPPIAPIEDEELK